METQKAPTTIDELRNILADEIKRLRNGETTAANVNATTNAVGKIFSSVKLELEYNKLTGKHPNIQMMTAVEVNKLEKTEPKK